MRSYAVTSRSGWQSLVVDRRIRRMRFDAHQSAKLVVRCRVGTAAATGQSRRGSTEPASIAGGRRLVPSRSSDADEASPDATEPAKADRSGTRRFTGPMPARPTMPTVLLSKGDASAVQSEGRRRDAGDRVAASRRRRTTKLAELVRQEGDGRRVLEGRSADGARAAGRLGPDVVEPFGKRASRSSASR